jgi:tetratricopeptide (TPR) repeat protein
MGKFLPGYRFSLGPFPEDWAQKTAQLRFRGQLVGVASLALNQASQEAPEALLALWPLLAETTLEKIVLKKALVIDPLTGLYNIGYFKSKLYKLLNSLMTGPRAHGLWEGSESPALVLAITEIGGNRRLTKKEFIRLARILKAVPDSICLARLGDRRLGFVFLSGPLEAQNRLDQARNNALAHDLSGPYFSGYALYPQDLALDALAPFVKTQLAVESLMAKAETALHFAYGKPIPAPVIGFGQLINGHGLITQILPQNRVVINLGDNMGAMPGQVFSVLSFTGEPKGEITVFETGEGYSLAHAPQSKAGRLAAGDKLAFSRIDWSGHPSNMGSETSQKALEIEKFEKKLLNLASTQRPLVLALARLDDHERLLAMAGEEEVDNRLALVRLEVMNGSQNPPSLLVPYGPATMAMVWTDLEQQSLKIEAENLVKRLKTTAPLSLALVPWPNPVLKAEDLLPMAQKTLIEAAMVGPTEVTFFGPRTLNISGDHYFDKGELERAVEEYQKGLILDPGQLNLLNSLGVCQGQLGHHKEAIAVFNEVLSLAPDNLMAHFNKACSLTYTGLLEEAELAFLEAMKIDPDNFEVLFHLGKTALRLGHLDQALPSLNKAAELKTHRGEVYRHLGQARLLANEVKGAMEAFKKAVKHNPDDADSLSGLGLLYLQLNNDQEVALSLFTRAVELDPTNNLFRLLLGRLKYAMGDYKTAEHHLKAALDYGCRTEEVQNILKVLRSGKEASAEAPA